MFLWTPTKFTNESACMIVMYFGIYTKLLKFKKTSKKNTVMATNKPKMLF